MKFISDRVAVMYLGRIVETGPRAAIFDQPRHPYSRALIEAVPIPDPLLRRERQRLQGEPPSPIAPPPGCRFHPRCPRVMDICRQSAPPAVAIATDHQVLCHLYPSKE